MFKLTIAFGTLPELSSFVSKMGGDVMNAEIVHHQPLTEQGPLDPAPAKPAPKPRSRSAKVTTDGPSAPTQDLAPNMSGAPVGGMPFPGGAPTNFAPGMGGPSQPAHQSHVPGVQQTAPTTSAPMTSAPMMAPPVQQAPEVSPMRKQWNDACGAVIDSLGNIPGITQEQGQAVIEGAYQAAGVRPGARISQLTDQEIQRFYPALNEAVSRYTAGANAARY